MVALDEQEVKAQLKTFGERSGINVHVADEEKGIVKFWFGKESVLEIVAHNYREAIAMMYAISFGAKIVGWMTNDAFNPKVSQVERNTNTVQIAYLRGGKFGMPPFVKEDLLDGETTEGLREVYQRPLEAADEDMATKINALIAQAVEQSQDAHNRALTQLCATIVEMGMDVTQFEVVTGLKNGEFISFIRRRKSDEENQEMGRWAYIYQQGREGHL